MTKADVEAVAEMFSLPKESVEVLSGHKSARKVLLVRGVSIERALSLLKINEG